ncbi:ribosome-associated translation inhibitor RaiA [Comamonas odontotermitis]|uniref:Ribosome-associated translation inhibitor RaiA n=1 Tax=Comamonas odontotermitis TaxID=379895 RepID=A0ABR6RJU6_9BURK|nr:HPF/RaiA family ribosome-associated protein [Comamonas odontotermitis]MBB6579432.1 ribosome-associated translation inhibitor RaiA [Comamonas odontotermitis]
MQVQVHAGDNVQGGESLAQWAQTEVQDRLSRFREYVTRVEVYLTDVDALKNGGKGKRCVMETRATGRQPLAVNAEAEKVAEAFNAALEKLHRALNTDIAKMRDKSNRDTIRTGSEQDSEA